MILMAHAENSVVQYVTCGCWKKLGRISYIFFRRDLCKFLKKFPVSLVFAQEPALNGEWTERKEIEITSVVYGIRQRTGIVVEIGKGKIEESQMVPERRTVEVAVARVAACGGPCTCLRGVFFFFFFNFNFNFCR